MAVSERNERADIINAKLLALKKYEHKDRPEWSALLQLLILDTREVSLELQQLAWEALSEAAKITTNFPGTIFTHATRVVTSGDGRERAFAAKVLCSIAEQKHSWPVSQRSGHAVAAVDDALLSLAVGMQDMNPQVRHDVVLLLPMLRTASEKYVNIVLDKRKTLLLQRKEPSVMVSKLPESPPIILEGAAGALSQLLEDEFDFVRCSAARAVAALSYRSPVLAETALELLMSALFDDEPVMRVAALAGMRIALNKLNNADAKTNLHAQEHPTKTQQPKKGRQIPDDLYQSLRNCLEDSSSEVRLATVRVLNGMKFPSASKLLPVLHRLITIASPLHWVPLPIAACHHPQQQLSTTPQHASITDTGTHESVEGENTKSSNTIDDVKKSYAACAMCVVQVLRTLATLAAHNAQHTREAVGLIMNSKCGFSAPNMAPLKDLLERIGALPEHSMGADAKASHHAGTASCMLEKTEQSLDSVANVDEAPRRKMVALIRLPSAASRGCKGDVQHDATPDSPRNMQEQAGEGSRHVAVDILKSAIEQGAWKLVPGESEQKGVEHASKSGPSYSPAKGADSQEASVHALKEACGKAASAGFPVATSQHHSTPSGPPRSHGQHVAVQRPAGTPLPQYSMAHRQVSMPMGTVGNMCGPTVGAVNGPPVSVGAQAYVPACSFAPAPRAMPLSAPPPVISQQPHPPMHAPGAGPARKRPALMLNPHVVQQTQLPAHSMQATDFARPWTQLAAPPVMHSAPPLHAPGLGIQAQQLTLHGNSIVIPHSFVSMGGNLQLGLPHVVPVAHQMTGAVPHTLHSMPSSMQPRPPVQAASLYSVTPVRPKDTWKGASEPSQSRGRVHGNTHDGTPHQQLSRQEERQAEIARLLPTPPVPRDPGSEILRSVATLVLIGNAVHALHGERKGPSDNLLHVDSSRLEAHEDQPQYEQDVGMLESAPWPESVDMMKGCGQPDKQTHCELKHVFQQWQHVWQALSSSGHVGEWMLNEVLPRIA